MSVSHFQRDILLRVSFPNLTHSDSLLACHHSNFLPFSCFPTELGDGPFSLVSAVYNDTVFGVNRTSSSVFPLVRERPGQLPAPGLLFNFMITAGLQKDRTSREHPHSHDETFTHIQTMVQHLEQFGVWCLAHGHFGMGLQGQGSNHRISKCRNE